MNKIFVKSKGTQGDFRRVVRDANGAELRTMVFPMNTVVEVSGEEDLKTIAKDLGNVLVEVDEKGHEIVKTAKSKGKVADEPKADKKPEKKGK